MKIRSSHVYLTLVLFTLGLLFSYNMQLAKKEGRQEIWNEQWYNQHSLQNRLINERETNLNYEQQLQSIQKKVADLEKQMAARESAVKQTLEELEKMRLLSGLTPVSGPGVIVTLNDSKNASRVADVNNYIVHEQDVRRVVNELLAAGAEAISINGQRLVSHSSIRCVGPTIIVNGVKSTIPFEVRAIGDPDVLVSALNMPGGVVEMLKAWTIEVDISKQNNLELPAYIGDYK